MIMKWVLFFFLLTCTQLFAQTKADDVKTFTLKNGLKFLVLEDNLRCPSGVCLVEPDTDQSHAPV